MSKQAAEIFIDAPIETVFRFITDWHNVSRYEHFIKGIEPVSDLRPIDRQCWAMSHFNLFGIEIKSLYRYWSIPPRRYGGEQVEGIFRGGFWFSLDEEHGGTRLIHGEFIKSRYRRLEWFLGFVFWRVLFRKDIERQLYKLKELLEVRACVPPRCEAKGRLARLAGHSLLD
jgi:hypothetical protein